MRRLSTLVIVAAVAQAALQPAAGHAAGDPLPNAGYWQLPNIEPRVGEVTIARADGANELAIRFSTWVRNTGLWPVDLLGVLDDPANLKASAYQCVWWLGRVCTGRVRSGTFVWHPTHAHFHLDGYARYELRSLLPDGSPDFSDQGLVRANPDKVSFCLRDSERDRPDAGPSNPLYACTPVLQGISPGWADLYDAALPGQQIRHQDASLPPVPDGIYALVVTLDVSGSILETNEDDNSTFIRIRLSGGGTRVEEI